MQHIHSSKICATPRIYKGITENELNDAPLKCPLKQFYQNTHDL